MVCGQVLLVIFPTLCFLVLIRLFLHRSGLIHVTKRFGQWVNEAIHVHQHFRVPQFNDSTQQEDQLFRRVSLYVNSLPSLEDSDLTNLFAGKKYGDVVLSLDDNQVITDTFLGGKVFWRNRVQRDCENRVVTRSFELKIRNKDRRRILKPYIQHIHAVADDIERRRKELKIHSHSHGRWKSVAFSHPSSFESVVMDDDLKSRIRSDLETFLKSKQYYHKIGRVWRRSYLLYGPSGTGKSSFVAAVANFLGYDVYNVNLSQVADDDDLNMLLLQTSPKSLIVVEHLDRYMSEKTSARITSSGFLNFMDGLLNFHDEKVMIFTVTRKEGIDSALLRPGRIDVHIYFPMCDFNSFLNLAGNYLGVKKHKLFPQVEEMFQSGATLSPAEMSELMLVNRSSPSRALKSVIAALQSNGRNGGKSAPPSYDSAASSPASTLATAEAGGSPWKENMPKEFRNLYGLLRLSCKKPGSLDPNDAMIS